MLAILDVCTPFALRSPSTDVIDTEVRLKHGFNIALDTFRSAAWSQVWFKEILLSIGVSYRVV